MSTKRALIDTDVVLDVLTGREPHFEFSAKVLALCETGQVKGFVTPVIISNLYYLLRKDFSHKDVITALIELTGILGVLAMNENVVKNALHSKFTDFEDALQHFSALQMKDIDIILTRNTKDYKKGSLPCMTPEVFIKSANL